MQHYMLDFEALHTRLIIAVKEYRLSSFKFTADWWHMPVPLFTKLRRNDNDSLHTDLSYAFLFSYTINRELSRLNNLVCASFDQCWEYSSPSPDSRPLFKDSDSYSDSYPWDSDSWNLRGLSLGLVIFVECLIVMSYYRATMYQQNINVTSNASSFSGRDFLPKSKWKQLNLVLYFGNLILLAFWCHWFDHVCFDDACG